MRHVMWSPLPPERSGISDYSYELLGALTEVTEVAAVARKPAEARVPQGVELLGEDYTPRPGDLNVYHMGNHSGVHTWIYERALRDPGVVVLHETMLPDFHQGYFNGIGSPAFLDEVRYAHGPIWGHRHDPALLHGWPAIEVDGVKVLDARSISLERRLVEASRGVIVHDPFAADLLQQRYPDTPIRAVPSGAPIRDDSDRAGIRARLGWQDDHMVFGIFGGFNPIKRMMVAVLAFAEIRRRWPQARLLICGHADYPEVLAEVERTIDRLGMAGSVHIALSPGLTEFEDLITATDVLVNLRWPTAGETSAVMMRAFGAGRMVITSDLPQHRHLDPAFCWRVPTDPRSEAVTLVTMLERILTWPDEARQAGEQAREYVRRHASWPLVASAYQEVLEEVVAWQPPSSTSDVGVNVFGDARATTGLAESVRRHALALLDAGAAMTFNEFNSQAPFRTVDVPPRLSDLRRGKDYPIDLWLVNVNEFQLIPDHSLDRYTIGLWAWELPEVPQHALKQMPRMDEMWVVSEFVADAFRTATDMPITVISNVVPHQPGIAADRARFGLPQDGLVVLFNFSASSSDARKNPWAVVDAFRKAFRPDERGTTAHLVIKVVDLERFPALAEALAPAVASVNGTLIGEHLTRDDMDCLLATCDIYISLHRSEGFGFGMAEAMAMGKPVIATGYGGNVDFMPPGSAAVVGYGVRPIRDSDHRYGAEFGDWYTVGQLWAEPDVDQAARWLRRLADNPELRRTMGQRAVQAIEETCSPAVVGAAMVRRLGEIASELRTRR